MSGRWQHRDMDIVGVPAVESGERGTWNRGGFVLVAVGLVLAVGSAVLVDNPWRLLVIDEHVGLMLVALGIGVAAVGVGLTMEAGWQPWVGGLGRAVLILEFIGVCAVGALYALGSTFGQASTVSETRLDRVTALRVQRMDAMLSSCSRIELLVGDGWSTKHEYVTPCVGDDLQQLVVTVAGDEVHIALPSGAICIATIDRSALALRPVEPSAACDTLAL